MKHPPTAIIGLASLFPRARTLEQFWANVAGNVDCIEDTPPSRWRREEYFDPDPAATDKTYCHRGGFVPDVDFDPLEFGLPPRSLEHVDTAQLLSLLVARDALSDAGYGAAHRALPSQRTGVVIGVAGTTMKLMLTLASRLQYPAWERALRDSGVDEPRVAEVVERLKATKLGWTEDAFPGFLANVVAGRIASRLDLGGMTCAVDAACASSLCAIRMAAAELTSGSCDVMIAGGVDTDNSIAAFMSFSKTPALSRKQAVRPFDADADGTLISEGIGMVVMKRLADAQRDGDRIYANVLGVGASSDGRSKSIYAPRATGQARALRAAYAQAGVAPSTVGLVEAHGTGTPVGDAAEIEALRLVLDEHACAEGSVALGSVKSQIGHTKAAAGVASLIKAALALHQQVLPPTLHVARPHPELGLDGSPLYLNTELRPWLRRDATVPRRAGVSAFGFGGANYHAVLEEPSDRDGWRRVIGAPRPVLLAAPDVAALRARCGELASALAGGADAEQLLTALAAAGSELAIAPDAARLGFVAGDGAALRDLLDAAAASFAGQPGAAQWKHPRGVWFRASAPGAGGVAALFPGQGSQYVGMGASLTLNFPELRAAWERFDAGYAAAGHARLSDVALGRAGAPGDDDRLRRTLFAQGAVGAVSMGAYALLAAAGLRPQAAIGHSFGELTALWGAGSLPDADFAALVRARGEALTAPENHDGGGMLAVGGAAAGEVAAVLPAGVVVANVNGPSQVVCGGPLAALDAAEDVLQQRGWRVRRLPVAAAFHTECVAFARAPWRAALAEATLRPPGFSVYANVSGEPYPASGGSAALELLAEQPFHPVRFADAVDRAWCDGCRVFVEIGPGSVLTGLVADILGDREHLAVAVDQGRTGDDDLGLRQAWVQLRVAGVDLSDIDPYASAPRPRSTPSATSVRVSAAGVVRAGADAAAPAGEPHRRAPAAGASDPAQPSPPASPGAPGAPGEAPPSDAVAMPHPSLLAEVHALRAATVECHREYLAGQARRAQALVELAGRQASMPPAASADRGATDATLAALGAHESELLRVHEQYLLDEAAIARDLIALAAGGRPAASAPGVAGAPPAPYEPPVRDGGPALASAPDAAPAFASAHGDALAPAPAPAPEPAVAPAHGETPAPENAPAPAAAAATAEDLMTTVVRVVAERTGYPPDFLAVDMELEADLGVDSIKRVEILAELRASLGAIPQPEPDALRGVRTLADIATLIASLRGEAGAPAAAPQQPPPRPRAGEPPAPVAAARASPQPAPGAPARGTLRRLELAPPAAVDVVFPTGRVALIGSDGGALTPALARAVERLGLVPVVLVAPPEVVAAQVVLDDDIHQVVLRDMSEAALDGALARIGAVFGAVAVHVHLHPETAAPAAHRTLLKNVLLRAKHLHAPLAEDEPPGRRCFVAACRLDGSLGCGRERAIEPLVGGLFGLTATLAQEWPGVHCRAIDLGPQRDDDPRHAAGRIVQELSDPDATVGAVAHTAAQRTCLQYAPDPTPTAGGNGLSLAPDDIVVATGGARGVTAACVIELARRVRCRFVLLGRTVLEGGEPEWARGCGDEPAELRARALAALDAAGGAASPRRLEGAVRGVLARREVARTLAAVAEAGGEARYVAVDVGDRAALAPALAGATSGWTPVTAILHGAGALADRRVADKTEADFDAVFGPKIDGLDNLLDAVAADELRWIALFGSIAGVAGNPGQADYAMANAVLDRRAHELARRLPHCRTVAVDWGPWDGGMVTPELRARFAARGVATIAPAAGADALATELARPPAAPAQVLVGPPPPPPGPPSASLLARLRLPARDITVLGDHRVAERAVVPAAWAAAWLAGAAERLRPDLRLVALEDFGVLKGIVTGDAPVELTLAVRELGRAPGEAVFEASIAGRDPVAGVERPHFRARVLLAAHPSAPPRLPAPDVTAELPGAEATYRGGPIAYGPAFATVRRVLALGERHVVTECLLPDPATAVPSGPVSDLVAADLADVATHGILIWLARFHEGACLPAVTGRHDFYRRAPRGEPVYVSLDIDALDDASVTFGYCVHDRDGVAYARAQDVRMTLLRQSAGDAAGAASEASPANG